MDKKDFLVKCGKVLDKPDVEKWYHENLEFTPQTETIDKLMEGVHEAKISIRDALTISLIVGIQWDVKFEGVP